MPASPDQRLISDVTTIILRHAAPARIWLFGSRASGDAHAGSDYDFAFDDSALSPEALVRIRDEADALPTLHKIDISNIAHAEPRFANRVRDTGRVLYSASKALRAETCSARWNACDTPLPAPTPCAHKALATRCST